MIVSQNGATSHDDHDTESRLNEAARQGGRKIKLVPQPAQSPYLDINDLGFFMSLESQVWREDCSTIDPLEGFKAVYGGTRCMTPIKSRWCCRASLNGAIKNC